MLGLLSACGPIMIHSLPGTGRRPPICGDTGDGEDIILPTGVGGVGVLLEVTAVDTVSAEEG